MQLQTEYPFRLPIGYLDEGGVLHQEGIMRMATAGDELSALRDARVKADETYMNSVVLSRVVLRLGTLPQVTPEVIEGLFVADMEYLQNMYNVINQVDKPQIQVQCPKCGEKFTDTLNFLTTG